MKHVQMRGSGERRGSEARGSFNPSQPPPLNQLSISQWSDQVPDCHLHQQQGMNRHCTHEKGHSSGFT